MVVMVSIDGLRAAALEDPRAPLPTLRALAGRGTQARSLRPVFPSVTYPSHASIATGVLPMRHGIAFNNLFLPDGTRVGYVGPLSSSGRAHTWRSDQWAARHSGTSKPGLGTSPM